MKRIIITIVIFAAALQARAQIGYNYSQYDFGFGGASTQTNSDFAHPVSKYAGNLNFTYNYSPYINYVIEFQAGTLAGDSLRYFPASSFQTQYTSLSFRAQVQLGEVVDYSNSAFFNALKNIYVGAGVGVIYTNTDLTVSGATASAKTSNIFLPLKAGYEFKVFNSYNEPWMKVDFGYQLNYAFTDQLDGVSSGKGRDSYTQLVFGIKFALGGTTSYRKQISY